VSTVPLVLNARDLGAKGNGVDDDTAVFQAALNSLALNNGGQLLVPPGTYVISSSLYVGGDGATPCGCGTYVIGLGSAENGAIFKWVGNATDPLFETGGLYRGGMSNVKVLASSQFPLAFGIRSLTANSLHAQNVYTDIVIDGTDGSIDKGVALQSGSGGDGNNDFNFFVRVAVRNFTTAAFSAEHTQSFSHFFIDCVMSHGAVGMTNAITGPNTPGPADGFFVWMGGSADHITSAVFDGNGPFEIHGINAESSARLLHTYGWTNVAQGISIEGSRFSPGSDVAADHYCFLPTSPGPFIFIGNVFESGNCQLYNNYTELVAIGNTIYTDAGGPTDWIKPSTFAKTNAFGNIHIDRATGIVSKWPDHFAADLVNAPGLATGPTGANNLRGAVTVTNTSTSGVVTFATPEPDNNYFVVETPTTVTGSPPMASRHVIGVSKTQNGFTLTTEAAPGGGNSVTFDWKMVR
jgi:hypothetical protein